MKRALAIFAVLVLLVLPVVEGATQEASAPQISIEHFAFGTPMLSVTVGTMVT
jgi:hypothetical protein